MKVSFMTSDGYVFENRDGEQWLDGDHIGKWPYSLGQWIDYCHSKKWKRLSYIMEPGDDEIEMKNTTEVNEETKNLTRQSTNTTTTLWRTSKLLRSFPARVRGVMCHSIYK